MNIQSTGLSDIEKGRNTRRKRSAQAPVEGLPLMTRRQLVSFLNANGIPISESVLAKLSSPKVGKGPPIHSWWGKRPLRAPGWPAPGLDDTQLSKSGLPLELHRAQIADRRVSAFRV